MLVQDYLCYLCSFSVVCAVSRLRSVGPLSVHRWVSLLGFSGAGWNKIRTHDHAQPVLKASRT